MEDALHDVLVMHQFVSLDTNDDLISHESSIQHFPHRLQAQGVDQRLLTEVNTMLVK